MSVSDDSFLTFAGEPVPGRIPPQLITPDNRALTTEQAQLVGRAYKDFCDKQRVSLMAYSQVSLQLPDGTAVRIVRVPGMGDRVFVTPAESSEAGLDTYFRAIPTNSTAVSGSGAKPSKYWRMSGIPADWPAQLRDASVLADHPGHITWSNPNLTVNGIPIVVGWRGPRDRYALSNGWTGSISSMGADNGIGAVVYVQSASTPLVAHEYASATIGATIFKDTGYVWINGRKLDTGLTKVIAACICQWDPVGHPGEFVLRVCTDYIAGARGLKNVDLGPGGQPAGLQGICEATSVAPINTYVAADWADSTGIAPTKWDIVQRPHFNKSGTQLATIIYHGTNNNQGVAFDATTWAIASSVSPDFSRDVEVVGAGTGHTWTDSTTMNSTALIAVDFDGDTFTWMRTSVAYSESGSTTSDFHVGGTGYSRSWTWSRTWGIEHSALGTLFTHTASGSGSVTVANDEMSGTATIGDEPNTTMNFVGDLSRGTFAIGYTTASQHGSISGSGTPDTINHTCAVTAGTATDTRMTFDVYFDGVLLAAGTTGAYTNAAPTTQASGINFSYDTSPVSASSSNVTSTTGGGGVAWANCPTPYPGVWTIFKHCAVSPLRKVAYLGAQFKDEAGHLAYGLELGAFHPSAGVAAHDPPAYAGGTFPTLSAPVFPGPQPAGTL